MKKIINQLIQYQELLEAKAQQVASPDEARLSLLNKSIKDISKSIPQEIRSRFDRLHERDIVAIAPVYDHACSACGMNLAISEVYTIKGQKQIRECPSCGRLLYFPQHEIPKRTKAISAARQKAKAGIERFSSIDLMIPKLTAKTRDEAIQEMAEKLASAGFVDDSEKLTELALKREAIVSTALGHGIAFPHVRGMEGGGLTFALGVSSRGIPFDPTSKKLTRIIFFIVIPTAASAFYLKLLSGLSGGFEKADARKKLIASKTPAELWKALNQLTRKALS